MELAHRGLPLQARGHGSLPGPQAGSHAPFQRAGRTWHAHLIFLLRALPCEAGFKGETAVAPGSGQAHSRKREQAHWPLAFQTQSFQPGAHVAIHSARDKGTTLLDSPLWNLQSPHVRGDRPPADRWGTLWFIQCGPQLIMARGSLLRWTPVVATIARSSPWRRAFPVGLPHLPADPLL